MINSIYPVIPTKSNGNDCAAISEKIARVREALDNWHANIPQQSYPSKSEPISVFASNSWFSLAYCQSLTMLYRHYLTYSHRRTTDNFGTSCRPEVVDAAIMECASRAQETCLGYRQTYQRHNVRYTWDSLHTLFMAGLTYLHCLWSSEVLRRNTKQLDVMNTCTSCNMVLVIIAERWRRAATYRDIFEALAEKTLSMICGEVQAVTADSSQLGSTRDGMTSTNDQFGNVLPLQGVLQAADQDEWFTNLGNIDLLDDSNWLLQGFLQDFGHGENETTASRLYDYGI